MSDANTHNLSNIDPDEISDVLLKVERSFQIRIDQEEFLTIKTFGNLCDIVANKVKGIDSKTCTTQQAFYKIRNAIAVVQGLDKASITPGSELQILFPRYDRNKKMRRLQRELGIISDLLDIKPWLACLITAGIVGSLLLFFFQWRIAISGLVLFITMGWLADRFLSKELKINTVKQLTEKLSREHYIALRRNATTINRSEIARKVKELFKADLGLEDHLLTRDATFS